MIEQLKLTKDTQPLYFYINANEEKRRSHDLIFRALLKQAIDQATDQDDSSTVADWWGPVVNERSSSEEIWNHTTELLSQLEGPFFVVLDALDETDAPDRAHILNNLARFLGTCSGTTQIKILLTSRNETDAIPQIRSILRPLDILELEIRPEDTRTAIERYVQEQIEEHDLNGLFLANELPERRKEIKGQFVRKFIENCKGMYGGKSFHLVDIG